MLMRQFVILGPFGSTNFAHVISQTALFYKKVIKIKYFFDFLYNFFSETFVIIRETERNTIKCVGFHVKYSLFLSDFNET